MSTPDVSVRKKHDIVILDVKKSMVGNVSSQLGSIVEEEVTATSGPICLKFILNLEQVTYWTAPPPVILSLVSEV